MGFRKNNTQKRFKKEMKSIEKEMIKKEKSGEGPFASKIHKLKFYGYKPREKKSWVRFFISEFFTVLGAVIAFFLILFGLVFACIIFWSL